MRLKLASVVAVAVLGASSGCATVFKGSHATLHLNSEPEGASVVLNGNRIGTTPMEFNASTKDEIYLQFRAEGYEPRFLGITHSVGGGWIVLDILLPIWVLNILVDALTGSWFYLDQENINVELERVRQPPPPVLPPPSPPIGPPQSADPDV